MKNSLEIIFKDILKSIRKSSLIKHLLLSDLIYKYQNTYLGPFWQSIFLSTSSFGIGYVWSNLFMDGSIEIIFSIAIGFMNWQYISSVVSDATSLYTQSRGYLLNYKIPPIFFNFINVLKNIINLLHNIILLLLIAFIFDFKISFINLLWLPIYIILIIGTGLFLSTVISTLCVFFDDLENLIKMILPFLFFISPILFKSEVILDSIPILRYNPISNYIDFFRDIFSTNLLMLESILPLLFTLSILIFLSCATYSKKRFNIVKNV